MSRKAIQRLAVAFATAIALVTGFSAVVEPPDTGWERHAAPAAGAPDTGWEDTPVSTNKTGWE